MAHELLDFAHFELLQVERSFIRIRPHLIRQRRLVMRKRLWLIGLALAVPLVSYGISIGIQWHFDSDLQSMVRQEFPTADPLAISLMTFARLCKSTDTKGRLADTCGTKTKLNLMGRAALVVGAVGIAFLILIHPARRVAPNRRTVLIDLFTPRVSLTSSILAGLVLVHASLAIAAIYFLAALAGRIPIAQ
jgi:hypothetical protein